MEPSPLLESWQPGTLRGSALKSLSAGGLNLQKLTFSWSLFPNDIQGSSLCSDKSFDGSLLFFFVFFLPVFVIHLN